MRRFVWSAIFCAGLMVGLAVAAWAQAAPPGQPSPADPIIAKLDMDYARKVIEDLTKIGSSPLGFRTAGSPEDLATAKYIAAEMRKWGLKDVGLEGVPVDMWRFRSASLTATVTNTGETMTFQAASQGGVPPTARRGISGEIVWVGEGTALDYDRLEAQGIDVTGKLALATWDSNDVWTNHMMYEAHTRGAAGLIITVLLGGNYYQGEGAIGSFDATTDPKYGTFITISKEDAQAILNHLNLGHKVRGTMKLDVEVKEDTTGWNTYGVIPGAKYPDQPIIFSAHHDAWFYGAIDDTSGVATVLATAKAIHDSRYVPDHTLVFTTHTGEEFGYLDTYYDWLIGAWWQITSAHTEWQSSAIAFINFEGQGFPEALRVNVNQELRPYLHSQIGRFSQYLPYGATVLEVYSWNELFTFYAAGVPGVTFATTGSTYIRTIYHTQLDTIDKIDFAYLRKAISFETVFWAELDRMDLQPYDFTARASNVKDHLDYRTMKSLDVNSASVRAAATRLEEAAWAFQNVRGSLTGGAAMEAQTHLREAVRIAGQSFTALSVWDFTVYPHEQTEDDAVHLRAAIQELSAGRWKSGLRELEWWVGQMWYAPRLSEEPFAHEMSHHDPVLAEHITWGGQGHLSPYLNLWSAYHSVLDKASAGNYDFSAEIAELRAAYYSTVAEYETRVQHMASQLNEVARHLELAAGGP